MSAWFDWGWSWLDKAGPIANFLQIAAFLFACATVSYVRLRGTIRHKDTEIANLKDDVRRREEVAQRAAAKAEELRKKCAELEQRLPTFALKRAEREWLDGNDTKSQYELALWLDQEGKSVAQLLMLEAEWAATKAVGELRASGLMVAKMFAQSAMALDPTNKIAFQFASDFAALHKAEAQVFPAFATALTMLRNSDATFRFDADEVGQGLALQHEAEKLGIRGHYHIATLLVDRAIRLLRRQLGPSTRQTLGARRLKVHLLIDRGEFEGALIEANSIIADTTPLGKSHPDTLASRYLLAGVLTRFGKPEEALPIIREVVAGQQANPALGPSHPQTLMGGYLLAETLCRLGEPREALPVIQEAVSGQRASPVLGPHHPHTLMGGYLLAQVLTNINEAEEALPVIQQVVEEQETSPVLGPSHPHTLTSRLLLAQVLVSAGKSEQALPVAERVVAERKINPALGANHPETLLSEYVLATMLERLGRPEQALSIIDSVIAEQVANSALGPNHPETLMSRQLLARVLNHLNRPEEALPVIQDVVAKQQTHPALGQSHPHTLSSRQLFAMVLDHLGRREEALSTIRKVFSEQAVHPALGPDHPDTTISHVLLTIMVNHNTQADTS